MSKLYTCALADKERNKRRVKSSSPEEAAEAFAMNEYLTGDAGDEQIEVMVTRGKFRQCYGVDIILYATATPSFFYATQQDKLKGE